MGESSKNISLRNIITTVIITLVASPIFIQSFGGTLLGKKASAIGTDNPIDSFNNESNMIYLSSSICGQIGYSLFSSLAGGFFIFPTFENSAVSARIHETCLKDDSRGFINTLLCLFLSSLLTGLLALTISFTGLCKMLDYIPLTVVIVTMVTSGARLFMFGCYLFVTPEKLQSGMLILASILVTVMLILLLKKYKNPMIMLYYVLGIIIAMNAIKLVFSSEQIYKWRLFFEPPKEGLSIRRFLGNVHLDALNFSILSKTWSDIISMGLFPLIPFAVNLPVYAYGVGISFNTFTELRAFAISNLLSSLAFYPTYFNCSGSMLFHMCGSNTRIHSLIAGLTIILFYFFFHSAAKALPIFSVSLLLQFIGISFLLSYIPMVLKAKAIDMFVMIALIALSIYFSLGTIQLIVLSLVAAYFLYIIHSGSVFRTPSSVAVDDGLDDFVIRVSGPLVFYNVDCVVSCALGTKKACVIDIEACNYIDMAANFGLRKVADALHKNGNPLRFIGKPSNFYTHLYDKTNFVPHMYVKAAY